MGVEHSFEVKLRHRVNESNIEPATVCESFERSEVECYDCS